MNFRKSSFIKALFNFKYSRYIFSKIRFRLYRGNEQQKLKKLNYASCKAYFKYFRNTKVVNYFNPGTLKKLSNVVFVFWNSSEDTMPSIVKECVKRLKETTRFNVILLNSDNLNQYSTLNNEVFELYENKKISIQLFSDLLRINLLSIHDAIWVDSTVFLIKDFPNNILDLNFVSPYAGKEKSLFDGKPNIYKFPDLSLSQSYFMCGNNKNIFIKWYNLLLSYLMNESSILENIRPYFVTYYAFEYLITEDVEFKKEIGERNISNVNAECIEGLHDSLYDDKLSYIFGGDTYLYKLSNKMDFKKTIDDKLTVYGEFCNRFKFDE